MLFKRFFFKIEAQQSQNPRHSRPWLFSFTRKHVFLQQHLTIRFSQILMGCLPTTCVEIALRVLPFINVLNGLNTNIHCGSYSR